MSTGEFSALVAKYLNQVGRVREDTIVSSFAEEYSMPISEMAAAIAKIQPLKRIAIDCVIMTHVNRHTPVLSDEAALEVLRSKVPELEEPAIRKLWSYAEWCVAKGA